MDCPLCGQNDFITDYERCELICKCCGWVTPINSYLSNLNPNDHSAPLYPWWLREVDPRYLRLLKVICEKLALTDLMWLKACRWVFRLGERRSIKGAWKVSIAIWAINKAGFSDVEALIKLARGLGFNLRKIPKFEMERSLRGGVRKLSPQDRRLLLKIKRAEKLSKEKCIKY